jgi:hypothetical protein
VFETTATAASRRLRHVEFRILDGKQNPYQPASRCWSSSGAATRSLRATAAPCAGEAGAAPGVLRQNAALDPVAAVEA